MLNFEELIGIQEKLNFRQLGKWELVLKWIKEMRIYLRHIRHEVCKRVFKGQRLSFGEFSIKVQEQKEHPGTGIEKKQMQAKEWAGKYVTKKPIRFFSETLKKILPHAQRKLQSYKERSWEKKKEKKTTLNKCHKKLTNVKSDYWWEIKIFFWTFQY